MAKIKKTILCKIDGGVMLVYEDGTYRCSHWEKDDISEWLIIGDEFHHKHMGEKFFSGEGSYDNKRRANVIKRAIKRRIDKEFEKVILSNAVVVE